jgi:hypothetical protein
MIDITPESFLQREVVMEMRHIQDGLLELCNKNAFKQLYDQDEEFAKLYKNLCKGFQDITELARKRGKESIDKIKTV